MPKFNILNSLQDTSASSNTMFKSYCYQDGDTIIDPATNQTKVYKNGNWYLLGVDLVDQYKGPKKKSIIDELENESKNDIIETMLLIMIQKGIVKDLDEFKEILNAAKLARTLTED